MSNHILLIDCPDKTGLIHSITGAVFRQGLNVVEMDEFVSEDGHFFMRMECTGQGEMQAIERELRNQLPTDAIIRINPKKHKDVVVFATKEHHCLGDMLIRYAFDTLNANILAVISNYQELQPLVSKFGIPFHFITHENRSREEHEAGVVRALEIYQPEYLVLAKYMRVLTPTFVERFPNRIINIHHSFLPAFIGANPYRQAYERGVKIIGATAHIVNNNLDEGPIVYQGVVRVDHRYSAKDMAVAGREVERDVLAQALKIVFEDRVFIHHNKTIVF
jgi:formyltetrahydrofolate deformylase